MPAARGADDGEAVTNVREHLNHLYRAAGVTSYRSLGQIAALQGDHLPPSTISKLLTARGRVRPTTVQIFVRACLRYAEKRGWQEPVPGVYLTLPYWRDLADREQGRLETGDKGRWRMLGSGGADARAHFTTRATGQRRVIRGGDLFQGRRVALAKIREWLTSHSAPQVPLVVTGPPGIGKSAVVARSALALEDEGGPRGLAFYAHDAEAQDLLAAVAEALDIVVPADSDPEVGMKEILFRIGNEQRAWDDSPDQAVLPIVVDGLDEAASSLHRSLLAQALLGLAALPRLRVVVATRPRTHDDAFAPNGLLVALNVRRPSADNLLDLTHPRYADPSAAVGYAASLLGQAGIDHPGPPGMAWETYLSNSELCYRLAGRIAAQARGNFLVVALAATPLSEELHVVDPRAQDSTRASPAQRRG